MSVLDSLEVTRLQPRPSLLFQPSFDHYFAHSLPLPITSLTYYSLHPINPSNHLSKINVMEYSEDKKNVDMVESLSDSDSLGFDEKATQRLIRKIDWVLLPFLALLYLLSFLDRTNIGNARLAGLEKDLGMKGLDYNVSTVSERLVSM